MNGNEILNLSQARKFLGVSEKTLRNYCKAGKVPFHHEKNERGVMEYRFRREDLEVLSERRKLALNEPKSKINYGGRTGSDKAGMNTNDGIPSTEITVGNTLEGLSRYQEKLILQLQEENQFLKDLLLEKDKQLSAKDKQIERHMERISSFNESLTALAESALKRLSSP